MCAIFASRAVYQVEMDLSNKTTANCLFRWSYYRISHQLGLGIRQPFNVPCLLEVQTAFVSTRVIHHTWYDCLKLLYCERPSL